MDLETLLSERQIGRLLADLALAMDRRDWAALDAIIADDATADFGLPEICRGRAAIVANFRSFLGGCGPSQHLLGNLVVDVEGETAESRCYVHDLHQGAGAKSHLTFLAPGQYRDRWRRIEGRWWLVHRQKLMFTTLGSLEILGPG